jgi:hypothetical protein
MTTKNKIKLELTKNEISILANSLDVFLVELEEMYDDDESIAESVRPTTKGKKYLKQAQKIKNKIDSLLAQGAAHELRD